MIDEAFFALAIAVGCYIATFVAKDYLFIGDIGLVAQDRALQLQADTTASTLVPPFVVIDIDDTGFARLGYPPVTPRAFIAKLLEVVGRGQPRLIVVDIDLAWRTDGEDAGALRRQLELLTKRTGTFTLFVRQPFHGGDGSGRATTLRATAYDDIVDTAANMLWIEAVAIADGDGITRRYLPGQLLERGDAIVPLPNVQLAACVALQGARQFDELKRVTAPRRVSGPSSRANGPLTPDFACHGKIWPLTGDASESSRIVFKMRWSLPDGSARPQIALPGRETQVEEVEILNAVDFAAAAPSIDEAQARQLFDGRIVIIGSSAEDVGDIYRTSIGTMPGMLVTANGMRSAVEAGPILANNGYLLGLFVTVGMTAITFLFWLGVRELPAYRVPIFKYSAFVLSTILWLLIASWAFASGYVIEFVFPQYLATGYLLFATSWQEAL